MKILAFLIAVYLTSVAIIFAGMILTPTKRSQAKDAEVRRHARYPNFELFYLAAKLEVALAWPLYYLQSLREDRKRRK